MDNKEKKEVIEVDKNKLDRVLDEMDALKADNKELRDRVDATVDEGRKQRYEDKNKKPTLKKVKLTVYKGKIVKSWSDMPLNKVEKVNGKWITEQSVKYTLEDDTVVDMLYEESVYLPRIDASIEATKEISDLDPDGNKIVLLDLVTEDGKKLTIDHRFVN